MSKPLALLDEQGALWPSPHALAAYVQNYAGDAQDALNGVLVEVSAYLPEHFMFEVHSTVERGVRHPVGEVLYARLDELAPLNALTQAYLTAAVEAAVPVYPDEVYDLRDRLDADGVHVKAAAVAEWTAKQRQQIEVYLVALRNACDPEIQDPFPAKPKELL